MKIGKKLDLILEQLTKLQDIKEEIQQLREQFENEMRGLKLNVDGLKQDVESFKTGAIKIGHYFCASSPQREAN